MRDVNNKGDDANHVLLQDLNMLCPNPGLIRTNHAQQTWAFLLALSNTDLTLSKTYTWVVGYVELVWLNLNKLTNY